MSAEQRADIAADLADVARSRDPQIWFNEQIAAAVPEIETDGSTD